MATRPEPRRLFDAQLDLMIRGAHLFPMSEAQARDIIRGIMDVGENMRAERANAGPSAEEVAVAQAELVAALELLR